MSGLYWGYPDNLPVRSELLILIPANKQKTYHYFNAEYPNNPDVDIRDSGDDYLIDIEVPGVKSTADVHLDWSSSRSFVLSGNVRRPGTAEVDESKMDDAAVNVPVQKKSTGYERNGSVSHKHNAKEEVQAPGLPHLLAGERRVGFFKRVFTLPVEVDAEKVTAKLEAGLLSLKVPKHQSAKGKGSIAIISAD
ncbi:Heat shock 70 kDa protein 1A [Elasticomyces elasticus]|nr:Heat shock 70 kDa protein 1A [Elasticomyces elasticus]KAK5765290.1 Heat shock 70 kDa protein 1A [Elasticomyces elasticus]